MKIKDISIILLVVIVVGTSIVMLLYSDLPSADVIWMQQGDELNVLDSSTGIVRNVTFYNVAGQNRTTPMCGFIVDGDYIWIEEGRDNELNGVKIYVRKVVLVRDQLQDKDVCKVAFANVIVKFNETGAMENDTVAVGNGTGQQTATEEPVEQNTEEASGEPVAELQPVGNEAPPAEETPAETGLLSRIWKSIKNLLLSFNVPSR